MFNAIALVSSGITLAAFIAAVAAAVHRSHILGTKERIKLAPATERADLVIAADHPRSLTQ